MIAGIARFVTMLIGVFFAGLGLVGVIVPGSFFSLVPSFQNPDLLYVVTANRVTAGLLIIYTARMSRLPWAMYAIGTLILIGGLVTPFAGRAMSDSILLSWTNGGDAFVRIAAAVSLLFGGFLIWALIPRTRSAELNALGSFDRRGEDEDTP